MDIGLGKILQSEDTVEAITGQGQIHIISTVNIPC